MSVDPRVQEALSVLGETYGPLGVALVFALAAAGVDDKQVLRDQLQSVLGAAPQPAAPAVAAGPPVPSVGRMVHYVSYGTPAGEFPSVCRPRRSPRSGRGSRRYGASRLSPRTTPAGGRSSSSGTATRARWSCSTLPGCSSPR
ncbi:hypothetical protein [Planotetraspora sp. GP83]|uniref:hypothetical protein n=1 Tax=Planotetraspora sp. GP83 TaxID=3156264 RepID=UPI003512FD6C